MTTLVTSLLARAEQHPNAPAWHAREADEWSTCSWLEHVTRVRVAARGLMALGLTPGAKVAIRAPNRPEWLIAAMATLMTGGVIVGVYRTASAKQVRYVIDHSQATIALVDDQAAAALVDLGARPGLQQLVTLDAPAAGTSMSWEQLLAGADAVSERALDERIAALRPAQLASIVYTSGTTGAPKGVMLSHHNLLWAAEQFAAHGGLRQDDSLVSYLPLAHIAEQLGTLYIPTVSGMSVWLCDDLRAMPEVLRHGQPSVLFGVPQVWQRFRAEIEGALARAPAYRRLLFALAHTLVARATMAEVLGRRASLITRLGARLADAAIMSKARTAMGLGNTRWTLSGSGPIDLGTLEFFVGLGIVLHEGYGLTETTAATVHNLPGKVKFGTVGRVVDGVDLRIAEDGEVLLRGPNVFVGYFEDEAQTRATLRDGWLHTGDLGSVDAQGFLSLTGRKGDMIVTAGGKNIAPVPIEQALESASGIEHAVVIGEARRYLVALIWLSEEAQPDLDAVIAEVNADLSRAEQLRAYRVVDQALSIEDGTLTPTLKVRRRDVAARFEQLIEQLYARA